MKYYEDVIYLTEPPVCDNSYYGADLVEGGNTTLRCDVIYSAIVEAKDSLTVGYVDDVGSALPNSNTTYTGIYFAAVVYVCAFSLFVLCVCLFVCLLFFFVFNLGSQLPTL